MKKYLWFLILLPLVGFTPVHMVVTGVGLAAGMSETSEETMTWYQCRAEAQRLNDEMNRMTTGAERPVIEVSCRFGFGEENDSDTYEGYNSGYDDEFNPDYGEPKYYGEIEMSEFLNRTEARLADIVYVGSDQEFHYFSYFTSFYKSAADFDGWKISKSKFQIDHEIPMGGDLSMHLIRDGSGSVKPSGITGSVPY